MLYSQLFGKTSKTIIGDVDVLSHQLLLQAGFIRESSAGRYFFLPHGIRVQQKIMKIIKEEMDKSGAQEMITPVLHPLSLWQETNRDQAAGYELMQIKDRHGGQFALGGTAEEMFVDVVRKFQLSYKDLPLNLYQFSSKFRDELRVRGGLLRVREFMMKDAYSFDIDETEFKKTYQKMREVYQIIFKQLGLETVVVEADNGYIGGDYCHEFVVENETGESHYYLSPNQQQAVHDDIATNEQKQNWTKKRGIEVGNIFQLGLYYSNKMHDATFVDQSGQKKPYYMGCYGIGIGRTLATIVEVDHDNNGIVWPENVAPYQYHLCGLDLSDPTVKKQAYELYQKLSNQGKEVLFDDRENISAGAKFADADLIGIPNRLVISKRTGGKIELKKRSQTNSDLVTEI